MEKQKKQMLSNAEIQDLITIQMVEEAKERIVKWLERTWKTIKIPISIIIFVFTILSFLGIKSLFDIHSRAQKASEIVEKTTPKVINFAITIDSLEKKFLEISLLSKSRKDEIDSLKSELILVQKELERNVSALRDLLSLSAQKDSQLKSTLIKYENEKKEIEKKRTQLKNSSTNILIKYSVNNNANAEKCEKILKEQGFPIKLQEITREIDLAYFRDNKDYDKKIHFFDNESSQKAIEVKKLLVSCGKFESEQGDSKQRSRFSLLIWILK